MFRRLSNRSPIVAVYLSSRQVQIGIPLGNKICRPTAFMLASGGRPCGGRFIPDRCFCFAPLLLSRRLLSVVQLSASLSVPAPPHTPFSCRGPSFARCLFLPRSLEQGSTSSSVIQMIFTTISQERISVHALSWKISNKLLIAAL